MTIANRRSFLLGGVALIASPAIVRAESLMKVIVPKQEIVQSLVGQVQFNRETIRLLVQHNAYIWMNEAGWAHSSKWA